VRVLVIPDVHLDPREPDVSRLGWIGALANDERPDHIVQLGDLATLDSVSGHAPPGTLEWMRNPRILADFDVVQRGLDAFERAAAGVRAPRWITKGNHEYRLDRFEDKNPQAAEAFVGEFDALLERRKWRVLPFREWLEIEGALFTHIPFNAGGKPYGGKTAASRIANDAGACVIHGHTHQRHTFNAPKIGPGARALSVISAGCALPQGHVEAYARHNATGWWWGVGILTIRAGFILDEQWISMDTLARRYRTRRLKRAA
jgi:3',5'-cyclic AMP phosphodiesterase CpdA